MKMFTVEGFEWMGCPLVAVILAEDEDQAKEKFIFNNVGIEKSAFNDPRVKISEVTEGYREIYIG